MTHLEELFLLDLPEPVRGTGSKRTGNGRLQAALTFVIGAWLVISPAMLGYAESDPWWNPMLFGTIVALVGLGYASGVLRSPLALIVNLSIGAWLCISTVSLSVAPWNVGVCGLLIVLLATMPLGVNPRRTAWRPRANVMR